jgi:beta-1,4-mannosyl-glycoprotein beta-1,4-N-acetylglucosaminyltransferase
VSPCVSGILAALAEQGCERRSLVRRVANSLKMSLLTRVNNAIFCTSLLRRRLFISQTYDALELDLLCCFLFSYLGVYSNTMTQLFPNRRWVRVLAATTIFAVIVLFYHGIENSQHIIHQPAIPSEGLHLDEHGFLKLPRAQEFCRAHKWKVYPDHTKRRKIYDLFMINTELDWLEIRLNELKGEVDYFVILESATTFTSNSKPLYLQQHWENFTAFHHKIIYRVLNDTGLSSSIAWDHEDLQRNAMFDQVFPTLSGEQEPDLGDVILVSDIDEIPRRSTLQVLRNCKYPRRLTLRSRFYYYSFQWLHRGAEWAHPQATIYEGDKTIRPANLRNGDGGNIIKTQLDKANLWNAAWHCSSCFATVEEMVTKITSFSHVGWNQPQFRNAAEIVQRVRNGLDLFDRKGENYDRVESNDDIPEYIKMHEDEFSYMLDRDPPNANFRDYTPEG